MGREIGRYRWEDILETYGEREREICGNNREITSSLLDNKV